MLLAASMGHTDCLTLLVNAGADVNAQDNVKLLLIFLIYKILNYLSFK